MYNFREVTLKDREWIVPLLKSNTFRSSEFTFANLFAWGRQYNVYAAEIDGSLVIKSGHKPYWFTFPVGGGDNIAIIKGLINFCEAENIRFRLQGLTDEARNIIEENFPGGFTFSYNRSYSDYIYNGDDLRELKGKKYSAKRNHINNFLREHPDWEYAEIGHSNIPECRELVEKWCLENDCCGDPGKMREFTAVRLMLRHFDELELSGGMIRTGGEIIAFSLGEPVTGDTYVVHVEKTFSDIQGAYPIINREMARHAAANYKYINREEDMGVPGLRKSKLSYYPAVILDKYDAVLTGA